MKIDGIDYDIPTDETLSRWDYNIHKEGKTTYYELWIDFYENCARQSVLLCKTNRGSITLDGKKIKDKKESDEALKIFDSLSVFRKILP